MKRLLLIFVLLAAVLRAATGDINTVTILANGWEADVKIEGLNTGGTYDFGLGTNNDPATGTPKVAFAVVSEGYDDTGTLGTISRTIYGTHVVRQAYPNNASNEESNDGTYTTVRIALSDYIYVDDNTGAGKSGTAPTVTILSGFYTKTGTPNNASGAGFAVTNNSTLAYPKVTANWSWPGYQLMTSTSKLRCVAFEPHAQSGRPVRAVKFTVYDGTTTNTEYVTAATYDSSVGDACPVVEYVTSGNLVSGLTAKAELTCNFIAYPWVGDAASILDTSAGTAAPTPLYGPIKAVCDNAASYEVTCALVDPAGSDAGANTVYPAGSFNPATAYKFATISKALSAIKSYNNTNYTRNDAGAGIVYLTDGNHQWTGASNAYGNTPKTWYTITRASNSTSRAAVVITSAGSDKSLAGRSKLTDLTITASTAVMFTGDAALWFDQCDITYTGTAFVYSNGCTAYFTRSTLTQIAGGFPPYSSGTSTTALLRGCSGINIDNTLIYFTAIGNNRNSTTTITSTVGVSSAGVSFADNKIWAFNRWMKINTSGDFTLNNQTVDRWAVVQNVFEHVGTTAGYTWSLAADTSTSGDIAGVCLWHNTFVGERTNLFYNDNGANAPLRTNLSVKNNITDDYNIKTDTFGTANGARVGNWAALYGAGFAGNVWCDYTNSVGATGLINEFAGLKTLSPAAGQTSTYLAYTSRAAWAGGAAGAGNGTYTLQSTSPAIGMQRDWVLPYDLAGVARTESSAAGAYHYGANTGNFNFFFLP